MNWDCNCLTPGGFLTSTCPAVISAISSLTLHLVGETGVLIEVDIIIVKYVGYKNQMPF